MNDIIKGHLGIKRIFYCKYVFPLIFFHMQCMYTILKINQQWLFPPEKPR